jgi:hypothetical protein
MALNDPFIKEFQKVNVAVGKIETEIKNVCQDIKEIKESTQHNETELSCRVSTLEKQCVTRGEMKEGHDAIGKKIDILSDKMDDNSIDKFKIWISSALGSIAGGIIIIVIAAFFVYIFRIS